MRRGSREISIFSMSALDLFASALGAFILLTVVMIPYFPNTGDSPERVADIKLELEAETRQREQAEREARAAEDAARQAEAELERMREGNQIPPFDVVIAVDTTGSMEFAVDGLKSELNTLFDILIGLSESPGLGIVDFKDRCEGNRTLRIQSLRQIDASAKGEYGRFVNQMFAGNYGDPNSCNQGQPEAVDIALEAALRQSWRDEARKRVIVVVTDTPAYADREQATLSMARQFAGSGGTVTAVFVRSQGTSSNTVDFLRSLASAGGGSFVPSGSSFIGTLLVALLA